MNNNYSQQSAQTAGSNDSGYFAKQNNSTVTSDYITKTKETAEFVVVNGSGYSQRQARIVKSKYVRK
ncbi:MAG: hypothetical protein WA057_02290 [Candidatus Magasanikiibacteriota bacterium]